MVKTFIRLLVTSVFLIPPVLLQAQSIGIKTNLLYWGTTTPNLGVEWAISEKSSIDIQGGYNPWHLNGTDSNNKKIAHWAVQPEYRYWFCEKYMGHFAGIHAFYAQYNIGGHKIPLLLESDADQFRYKGDMYGAGISYGYQWMLNKHFNVELTLGVGFARMKYDKFECPRCGEKVDTDVTRNYIGPTRAGITLIYIINK